MKNQKVLYTIFTVLLFIPIWFSSENPAQAATDNSVTFKIPVPSMFANNPEDYVPKQIAGDGNTFIEAYIKNNDGEGYLDIWVPVTISSQNQNAVITIPKLDWSKADAFHIVIQAGDFLYPYTITKNDIGKTIEVKPDQTFVPISVDAPFANMGPLWKMKLCFTDKNGVPMNCFFNVSYGTDVPAGRYNIEVSGSDSQGSYGLVKQNYALTQSDSAVHFTKDNIAKVTVTMSDSQNKLKLKKIVPQLKSVGYFQPILMNGNDVYLSKQAYDQINFVYETEEGWRYKYTGKNNEISKDTSLAFDSNLAVSFTGLDETLEPGHSYFWKDNFHITDGQGNQVNIVPPTQPFNGGGKVQFKNNKTGKTYEHAFNYFTNPTYSTPDTEGTYTMTVNVTKSPIPVKPAVGTVNVLKPEPASLPDYQMVTATPVLKDGKFFVNTSDIKKITKDKASLIIDLSKNGTESPTVQFSAQQIQYLKAKHVDISVLTSEMSVSVPSSVLTGDKTVQIKTEKLAPVKGSLSTVFDFNIKQGDQYLHHFDQPISLAFKVDASKVKDTSKLKVYYYNEEKGKWEVVGGNLIGSYVFVTTNHFSTYGVFNTDNPPTEKPVIQSIGGNTSQPKNNTGVKPGQQDTQSDTQSNANQQTTDTQKNTNQQTTDTQNKASQPNSTESQQDELPNTATNTYNWLLLGGLLIILGLALPVVRKRKRTP